MDTDRLVKIAKALADPTRQRMLHIIRAGGEINCSQICSSFDLSQPTISHHLKLLAAADLISVRKEGQFHVITAREGELRAFAEAIASAPSSQPSPRKRAVRSTRARKRV